ncbi:MAG: DNA-binding CsgD family transcriptional regulator [Ulvibacter sp.]|jgi:DNA-binding CsgD family transcriptional regulator
MFYGFAVMVILLNFICFLLFEEKIFLFFSLALTALSPTFLSIDSLFPLLGINGIENIGAMQSAMFFISTVFGALFASKFLTLEEFYPKLKWVAASILGFSLMTIFTSWISASAFYSSVANIANFSVLALYFLAGITLFSKKKYAKFYVIALAIPLLFSLDFFVFKELGIYFLSTGNSHLRAATIVEMILMTFAIIYRMRAIKEEHEMRQTEMHIFLKRQEVLNRANTQELMQDIHLENLIMNYDLDGLEIKLLQYISEGKDNSKIAQKLNTTEREIELYTKGLYHKLEIEEHVKDDYQMVASQADYIYN